LSGAAEIAAEVKTASNADSANFAHEVRMFQSLQIFWNCSGLVAQMGYRSYAEKRLKETGHLRGQIMEKPYRIKTAAILQ
jgi:hypothetical protein